MNDDCPICYVQDLIHPAVLCPNRHGICADCWQRLNQRLCPCCREPLLHGASIPYPTPSNESYPYANEIWYRQLAHGSVPRYVILYVEPGGICTGGVRRPTTDLPRAVRDSIEYVYGARHFSRVHWPSTREEIRYLRSIFVWCGNELPSYLQEYAPFFSQQRLNRVLQSDDTHDSDEDYAEEA